MFSQYRHAVNKALSLTNTSPPINSKWSYRAYKISTPNKQKLYCSAYRSNLLLPAALPTFRTSATSPFEPRRERVFTQSMSRQWSRSRPRATWRPSGRGWSFAAAAVVIITAAGGWRRRSSVWHGTFPRTFRWGRGGWKVGEKYVK